MAETFRQRLAHAWNAFTTKPKETEEAPYLGTPVSYGTSRPDRVRPKFVNERTIISSIYTRLAIDIAAISIKHVRVDEDDRFIETIHDGLNECLTVDANIDQTGRHLIQDIAMTLFDKGVLAVVPVDTTINPNVSGSYDIKSMRVGHIQAWHPEHVTVSLFNEKKGIREDVIVSKRVAAIIENPLYPVMNEPNSTLQRLIKKLSLLDAVDEQSSSGKLDLLIKLPYTIRSDSRRDQADRRRADIENQLSGSKYGIAYVDGTESVTQLNRPVENNLLSQITYLTNMLYSQLGLTPSVFDGTADEKTMLNYYNRTIEPIVSAITDSMHRAFLTKTARSQGHAIKFYRDSFKLVPISDIAEIADKFTRNEIATSNEIRAVIGWKPSQDPRAESLRNPNMPLETPPGIPPEEPIKSQEQFDAEAQAEAEALGIDLSAAESSPENQDNGFTPVSYDEIEAEAIARVKALGFKVPEG